MGQFAQDLLACLHSSSLERDHNAIELRTKQTVIPFPEESAKSLYAAQLTPYALSFVIRELSLREKVKVDQVDGVWKIEDRALETTPISCKCGFRSAIGLPCRHILKLRDSMGENTFAEELIAERWTRRYYYRNHRSFIAAPTALASTSLTTSRLGHRARVNVAEHERYRTALEVTRELASLLSEIPEREFDAVLSQVSSLCQILRRGNRFSVEEVVSVSDGYTQVNGSIFNFFIFSSLLLMLPPQQKLIHPPQLS